MKLDVSPTRMELLKLRKKLLIAKRGHKLLKDKLDELVRIIMNLLKETSVLRKEAEEMSRRAEILFAAAAGASFPSAAVSAMGMGGREAAVTGTLRPLLNLKVPETEGIADRGGTPFYGFVHTSVLLDEAADLYSELLHKLVILSARERQIEMVADEIERTRRRVNALEYILIPGIEETIRHIAMKLEENERSSLVQLMRIKDVVRAPVAHTSAYPGVSRYPL